MYAEVRLRSSREEGRLLDRRPIVAKVYCYYSIVIQFLLVVVVKPRVNVEEITLRA